MKIYFVYKIRFESDGCEYVGITNQPIPDRIHVHMIRPCNAELSLRLNNGDVYSYKTLHEVLVENDDDLLDVYALEYQEIAKLIKPININGVSEDVKRSRKHKGLETTADNKRTSNRKRKRIKPIREGVYVCSICRESKSHTEYQKDRGRFNGLRSRCADCSNFQQNNKMTSEEVRQYIAQGGIIPKRRIPKRRSVYADENV